MELGDILSSVRPADQKAGQQCRIRWDAIAKPLRGLGLLEDAIIRVAAASGTPSPKIDPRAVIIMCADNGVVEESVTQTGQEVTALVTENFSKGITSVCVMAKAAGCRIMPVDIGVAQEVSGTGIYHKKIAYGTRNMVKEPAMTREETEKAILCGIEMVKEAVGQGIKLLATGEMGIGNTTTSSAVACVLLNQPVKKMTGRGAGLDDAGLQRKIQAIEKAIALRQPDPKDPIDVLSKVGGLDLAGLCGVFLGGAVYHVPVLADGFISVAAALCAVRLCPAVQDYIIATHVSKEPAAKDLLAALGLEPLITANMHLGEGTGAVAAIPLLDMALKVFYEMPTFQDIEMEAYEDLEQKGGQTE